MSVNIRCPNCGQVLIVSGTTIDNVVRCTSCHATWTVRDEGMPRRTKFLLGVGLGIPASLFLVFIIFWFGMRDTWEIDHRTDLVERCEAVLLATQRSDDEAAVQAYTELQRFIDDRKLQEESLVSRVDEARRAVIPAQNRLRQIQREEEERALAERKRREAHADAARRHDLEQREYAARLRAEREQRLQEAKEFALEQIHRNLKSPSTARFSNIQSYYIKHEDVFFVFAVVDAQNSYGAMLRDEFRLFLVYRDGQWGDITDTLTHEQWIAMMDAATDEIKRTLDAQRH